jgi:hypothetical protein
MKKPSRLARRIFRPLLDTNGPAKLALEGVDRDDAMEAVREVSAFGLVRVCDASDPLDALYVMTTGARGAFRPSLLDRVGLYFRMLWSGR